MARTDTSLATGILLTDQYQLTMAQLYYRMGLHEVDAQFDHFFRSYPDYGSHQAGYAVSAGLSWLLDWMEDAHFGDRELDHLRAQTGSSGTRLFDDDFLDYLRHHGNFAGITLRSIPEGRVVHPHVPINIVQGPLLAAQLLETALLNHINYPTLVATKASRVREAARGGAVLEFGLRRAQSGAATAGTRAALIGGADFTSYSGLSFMLGLDPKGTHAHSMVQAFMALGEGEIGAFRAYADVYPDDCLLLVDTINTLESGIPNAIRVFEELRRKGHRPAGIRLDSGDLAHLSVQAARMLDAAGFPDTSIVLSNQLDELVIWQIITQIQMEAPRYGVDTDALIGRLVYGVGTNLITSAGDSALDGVYKLVALRQGETWTPAIKISETPAKTLNPGFKRVWRLYDKRGRATADVLTLEDENPGEMDRITLRHPVEQHMQRTLQQDELSGYEALLEDVVVEGQRRDGSPDLETLRARREADLDRLDDGVRRIMNPHIYHVSLSQKLWQLKQDLIKRARQGAPSK